MEQRYRAYVYRKDGKLIYYSIIEAKDLASATAKAKELVHENTVKLCLNGSCIAKFSTNSDS